MKKIKNSCSICGSPQETHKHHLDWNNKNNNPINIVIVCKRCHVELHKNGYMTREELREVRLKVMERDPARFDEDLFGN